jgi:hypothetical protein
MKRKEKKHFAFLLWLSFQEKTHGHYQSYNLDMFKSVVAILF